MRKRKEWAPDSYIRNKLRQIFAWSPQYKAVRAKAETRRGFQKCAVCTKEFLRKETHVDHVAPVVHPEHGFVDWNTYVERLFCPEENLQILCKADHDRKCNLETEQRTLHGTGRFGVVARQKQRNSLKENQTNSNRLREMAVRAGALSNKNGRVFSPNPRRIAVCATKLETGEKREFVSALAASKALGVAHTNIIKVLNGHYGRKSLDGWTFSRLLDQNKTAEE